MLSSKVESWTSGRISAFVRALAAVQIAALVLLYIHDADREFSIRKGDFPVFYTGAVIAQRGDWSCLYDFSCNSEIQNRSWPGLQGNRHPFVYPPFVAQLLAPLGTLPHLAAQGVFVSLMALCFLAAMLLARRFVPLVREHFLDSLCVLSLFSPLTFGLFGGQNTALSLLCYSAVLYFLSPGRQKSGDFFAGAALGLWFFKPHYPLVFLGCAVLARKWRVLLGAAFVVFVYYSASALVLGPSWPLAWLSLLARFGPAELAHNAYQMVSLSGVSYALVSLCGVPKPYLVSLAVSTVLSLVLALCAARDFYRLNRLTDPEQRDAQFFRLFVSLGPLVVLISPHTHFYDSALCLFVFLRCVKLPSDRSVTAAIIAFILAYVAVSNRTMFAVTPLVLVPLYALAIAKRKPRDAN